MTKNFNQHISFTLLKTYEHWKGSVKWLTWGWGQRWGTFRGQHFSSHFIWCVVNINSGTFKFETETCLVVTLLTHHMSIITSLIFHRERNFQVSRDPLISSKCPRLISPTHWAEASQCDDSTETCRSENQGKDVGSDAGKAPPSWKRVQEGVREAIDTPSSFYLLRIKLAKQISVMCFLTMVYVKPLAHKALKNLATGSCERSKPQAPELAMSKAPSNISVRNCTFGKIWGPELVKSLTVEKGACRTHVMSAPSWASRSLSLEPHVLRCSEGIVHCSWALLWASLQRTALQPFIKHYTSDLTTSWIVLTGNSEQIIPFPMCLAIQNPFQTTFLSDLDISARLVSMETRSFVSANGLFKWLRLGKTVGVCLIRCS